MQAASAGDGGGFLQAASGLSPQPGCGDTARPPLLTPPPLPRRHSIHMPHSHPAARLLPTAHLSTLPYPPLKKQRDPNLAVVVGWWELHLESKTSSEGSLRCGLLINWVREDLTTKAEMCIFVP